MSYLNAYIEECPAFGWQGGDEFSTRIVQMANGNERRNAEWAEARHRYSMPFMNISKADYRNIKQMHLVCRGQLHCFRFRDQLDYEATSEVFGVGDGVTRTFQLSKTSTIDGVSYQRNCYAIVSAAITSNGSPVSPTIDYERGLVTFSVAPTIGAVLRWTGIFDIWVRFTEDYLPWSLDNPDATNGQVNVMEVPPPELVS